MIEGVHGGIVSATYSSKCANAGPPPQCRGLYCTMDNILPLYSKYLVQIAFLLLFSNDWGYS